MVATTPATTATTATTAEITFATGLTTGSVTLLTLGPRTAILALEATTLATATAAAMVTMTMTTVFAFAPRFAAGRGGRRRFGLGAEEAFKPADETTGFLFRLRLRLRPAVLIRLVLAWFKTTIVTALAARFAARFAITTGFAVLAEVAVIAAFTTGAKITATFTAAVATVAIGAERRPFVVARGLRLS